MTDERALVVFFLSLLVFCKTKPSPSYFMRCIPWSVVSMEFWRAVLVISALKLSSYPSSLLLNLLSFSRDYYKRFFDNQVLSEGRWPVFIPGIKCISESFQPDNLSRNVCRAVRYFSCCFQFNPLRLVVSNYCMSFISTIYSRNYPTNRPTNWRTDRPKKWGVDSCRFSVEGHWCKNMVGFALLIMCLNLVDTYSVCTNGWNNGRVKEHERDSRQGRIHGYRNHLRVGRGSDDKG